MRASLPEFRRAPTEKLAIPRRKWRQTKQPQFLRQAEVDYLLINSSWQSWLTEEEANELLDENNYELIREWQFNEVDERYQLLKVIESSADE